MKLAVISDIHGNWPALEAVLADVDAWRPEAVLVNGDVVNSGPSSLACWEALDARRAADGWRILRGNHEDYVVEWDWAEPPRDGAGYDLVRLSHWTYRQMGAHVAALAALPDRCDWVAPDGSRLLAMHASLLGNRSGIYPFTTDDDVRRRILPSARVFVTAHTHIPHRRDVGATSVVNVGSVGVPGDGDPRASYGRLMWSAGRGWEAMIQRVAYDREAAERAFCTTGFLEQAGPEAEMSLVELRLARDVRTGWSALYRDRILAGSITHEQAVREYLGADAIPYSFAWRP